MNSFFKRVLSAIVAVGVIVALIFFFGSVGLKILTTFAVVVGGLELWGLLFPGEKAFAKKAVFYVGLLGVFGVSSVLESERGLAFALSSMLFCLSTLILHRRFGSLSELTSFQARAILGFFYLGLIPSFAMHLLDLERGAAWYLTTLAVVFAGDSGAYITGTLWGRHKLMPAISPKKSIEGALGGLICSFAAGAICGTFVHENPWVVGSIGFLAGIVAQFGDLFESQLKRMADVKDSGKIMPGHGGVLDRIDGVLFAVPVMLLGAHLLS